MLKPAIRISGCAALWALFLFGCSEPPSTAPDITPRLDRPVSNNDVTVSGVEPDSAVRNNTLDVRIQGSGFDTGSEVRWLLGGVPTDQIVTNSVTYVNSQFIVANITIGPEADPALYDVEVTSTKGGKPGIGTETFEVLVEQEALPILSGGMGVAFAINDGSVIVGAASDRRSERGSVYYWQDPPPRYPVKWTLNGGRWTITRLATSASQFAAAYAINDAGVIAGSAHGRATLWLPEGGTVDLGPGCATGVNSSGTVIGMLMTPAGQQGVVWTRGAAGWNAPQFLDEALLPKSWGAWPLCGFIMASAINDAGIIVGTGPYNEPVKWIPQAAGGPWSSIVYLGGNEYINGAAYGINDRGDIIGTGEGVVPRIWLASGEEVDLAPYGTQSGFGTGINDSEIPDVVARAMDMNLPFATVGGLAANLPLAKRRMKPVSRRRGFGLTSENGAFDINNATPEHPMRIVGAVEDKPMVWTIR